MNFGKATMEARDAIAGDQRPNKEETDVDIFGKATMEARDAIAAQQGGESVSGMHSD